MPSDVRIVVSAEDLASQKLKEVANNARDVGKAGNEAAPGMDKASASIKTAGDHASSSSGPLGGLAKTLGDIGKIAAGIVVAQGLQQLPGLIGGAIGSASDLNESMSKVGVVFGSSAGDIEKWSKGAATNLGISQQAALESAGTFGNLFLALGLGQKPAADLSKNIVGLATDLASFNNLDPGEVLAKLRSGLVGEAEPLRSLGVNINETVVKAQALKMGFKEVNGTFTESEKVQARYALIMQQTGTAQGDFARTSDGLANQQRILKATVSDLGAQFGGVLLPVALKATQTFNEFLPVAAGLAASFASDLAPAIQSVADAVTPMAESLAVASFDGLVALAGLSWDAMAAAWETVGPVLAAAGAISWEAMQSAWKGIGDAISSVDWAEVANAVMAFGSEAAAVVMEKLAAVFETLKATIPVVLAVLTPLVALWRDLGEQVLAKVVTHVQEFYGALGPLLQALAGLEPVVKPLALVFGVLIAEGFLPLVIAITAVLAAVNLLLPVFTTVIVGAIKTATLAIETVTPAVNAVAEGITAAIGPVTTAIGGIAEAISAAVGPVSTAFGQVKDAFSAAGDAITGWVTSTWSGVADKLSGPVKVATLAIQLEWKLITAAFDAAWTKIGGWLTGSWATVEEKLTGPIKDAAVEIAAQGVALITGFISGIVKGTGELYATINAIRTSITGAFDSAGSWLLDAGRAIVQGLINGVGQMVDALRGTITSLVSGAISSAKKAAGIGSPSKVMHEEIGIPLMQGLINGIDAGAPGVYSAVEATANGIIDAMRDVLGIHSPSTEGVDAGGAFTDGVAQGLTDGIPQVVQAVDAVGQAMAVAAQAWADGWSTNATGWTNTGISPVSQTAWESIANPTNYSNWGDVTPGLYPALSQQDYMMAMAERGMKYGGMFANQVSAPWGAQFGPVGGGNIVNAWGAGIKNAITPLKYTSSGGILAQGASNYTGPIYSGPQTGGYLPQAPTVNITVQGSVYGIGDLTKAIDDHLKGSGGEGLK